jgi:hypothetical protein
MRPSYPSPAGLAAVLLAIAAPQPGQPCRFLYNTGRESTSRKRAVYGTFAAESQTDFPGGQAG